MHTRTSRFLAAGSALALAALALTGCSQRSGSTKTSSSGSAGSSGPAASSGSAAPTGSSGGFPKGSLIGVALPQKTSQNWVDAEGLFPKLLSAAGFKSQVQFANSGVAEQQSQISALISKGAKVLIVGAIDGSQLGNQLAEAKSKGIPIISYDRLVTNTKNVNYWVTFNPERVGELQGESLLKGLAAKAGHPKPYTVELFAGSPDDSNAKVFFTGAMKVLQPKINDGTLKVLSGQTTFEKVATQGWLPNNAASRMSSILTAKYSSAKLDGILSPNDTIARALLTTVKRAKGYYPPITGQDADPSTIKLIAQGVQYSTIDKATLTQVTASVAMVKELSQGKKVDITNSTTNNGATSVPTDLLTPILVTKANAAAVFKNDPVREPLTK